MKRWNFGHRYRDIIKTPFADNRILNLADVVPGKKYKIIRINGGCKLNSHLCAMGFIPNESFYVSSTSRGGALCIVVKETKFAIGRGMACKILVEEIKE